MDKRTYGHLLAALLCVTIQHSFGQVQNSLFGEYRLDPANPPANFTIGNVYAAGSALIVRGDQMGTPTGEVFRTRGPNNADTFWRLERGNLPVGDIFSLWADENFHVRANTGDLRFWTNDGQSNVAQRARLKKNVSITIGSNNNQSITGHFGVGSFNGAVDEPYTLFHADNDGQNVEGYRPGMREGLSGSRDLDFFYTGLIADPVNGTLRDAGAVWSRDASIGQGPGLYKFIYTGADGSSNTASGANGLEMGRFQPDVSLDEGYFGLGDWTTAAAAPTERLDLLNGKVRVRSLPTDAVSTSTEMVTVNMTNGVIEHRPIANLPDNCEWSMSTTAPNNVYTAVGASSPSCPDVDDKVGIGVTTMNAKLHVFANTTNIPVAGLFDSDLASSSTTGLVAYSGRYTTGPVRTGLDVVAKGGTTTTTAASVTAETSTTTATNRGLVASANVVGASGAATNNHAGEFNTSGPATSSVGVWSRTAGGTSSNQAGFFQALSGATTTYGIQAYGQGTGTNSYGAYVLANAAAATNHGVYALASNGTALNYGVRAIASGGTTNYGVHGTAAVAGTNFAGYFAGDLMCTGTPYSTAGGVWSSSDAILKTNPEPLANVSGLLNQLQPKTYEFLTVQYPDLNLPQGTQAGFYAQELEQVLPQLVKDVSMAAQFDSTGVQIAPARTLKAVNYTGLIPYLVAAMQEQNARIDQLQQQLDQCCNDGTMDGHSMQQGAGSGSTGTMDTDLRIVPNPIAASTQLRYTVGTPGRVRLEVSDNTGRVIEVLEEATRSTGNFTYEWNTQQLAAGTYFCTLYVNDEPLVKKAVKLNER